MKHSSQAGGRASHGGRPPRRDHHAGGYRGRPQGARTGRPPFRDERPHYDATKATQTIEGIIRIRPRVGGIMVFEETGTEIVIDKALLATALHEDIVQASIDPIAGRGHIIKVVTRAKKDFVGTVVNDETGRTVVAMSDPKMYVDIVIPADKLSGAHAGDKVLAIIESWDASGTPHGAVERVIGKAGLHETEINAIILDKGFKPGFSPAVERTAREIKEAYPALLAEEVKKRRDFRGTTTFTIDPADAKDFDDALSVRRLENGHYEIGVHIADPSFFIARHSPIDRAAVEKCTSIYLVDRTIPMLPEVLSNDLCSLNADEDKLTFSAVFEMTEGGAVVNRWFGRTIIRSNRRFTYEDAQRVLDAGTGEYYHELHMLDTMSQAIRKNRFAKGALEFSHDEVKFVLDANGTPISVVRREHVRTHELIEEFMILANAEVAGYMTKNDKKIMQMFVYRVHDVPQEDKMAEIMQVMRALGYNVPPKREGGYTIEDIAAILKMAEGGPHEHLVQMATVQSMAKAVYTTKNIGHFGLSLKYYTHFTSPIRRYPDIMVHRLLAYYLDGDKPPEQELTEYEALTRYATQMEIAASKAERESIKYKQAEFMASRVGGVFDGVITGVADRGIYVRENVSLAEGMVRLSDLRDDYYVLDKKTFSVVGERTKKSYTLGDKVRIQVTNANVEKKLIDYVFVA